MEKYRHVTSTYNEVMVGPKSLHLSGCGSSGELHIGGRIHIHQQERLLGHHPKCQRSLGVVRQHRGSNTQSLWRNLQNKHTKFYECCSFASNFYFVLLKNV